MSSVNFLQSLTLVKPVSYSLHFIVHIFLPHLPLFLKCVCIASYILQFHWNCITSSYSTVNCYILTYLLLYVHIVYLGLWNDSVLTITGKIAIIREECKCRLWACRWIDHSTQVCDVRPTASPSHQYRASPSCVWYHGVYCLMTDAEMCQQVAQSCKSTIIATTPPGHTLCTT